MSDLFGGDLEDEPLDEEVDMREDDEGWGEAGPRMVLHYQVVALELPVGVAALLDFTECVTALEEKGEAVVTPSSRPHKNDEKDEGVGGCSY